ncbi:integrin alpha-PS3-like isoform X2 [Hetaerina americana]|uniref:integrin alpha-PS3-like isoform X2 n=1 Tax=Hetaerina americana TaxID=62018 RepID=UPI003A7F5283
MQKLCGPRWKNDLKEFYAMNGICYWLNGSKDFDEEVTQLIPLSKVGYQGYKSYLKEQRLTPGPDRNHTFYFVYGEAGLSVDFVKNSSEIIIGAPGVLEWMGTVIKSKGNVVEETGDDDFLIPNPEHRGDVTISTYFGYSISSGHFLNTDKTFIVAGAPRDGNLKGKVFIFSFDGDSIAIRIMLEGSQLGEYFGSSVCVVDLNSDGLDDLVVGAPQYSLESSSIIQNTGDEGKIYVFINFDKGKMMELEDQINIMGSQQQGARFGTAISNIGDLNKDGYPDIAVGAPYDTFGHGAVYIYQGSPQGINPKFVQRIAAIKIDHTLRGFGLSISKGADVDGNHYNDIAIGAYESGQAVLLRSQPVIYFHAKMATDVYRINFTAKGFKAKACIHYTGEHAPNSINAAVTLTADETYGRTQLIFDSLNTSVYYINVTLKHRVEYCETFDVKILAESQDFSKPIEIKMKYILNEKQVDHSDSTREFCDTCAVVDPSKPTFIIHKVPYVTGCGLDDRCRTDMKTKGSLVDISSPVVIGSIDTMKMKVVVRNTGDPAFLSQTNITFPSLAPLIRIPKNCKELPFHNGTVEMITLQCEMGNPLPSKEKKELLLDFDMKNIPPGTKQISFNISSGSVGEELDGVDNIQEIKLPLQTIPDLSITGKSSPDQFYLVKRNESYSEKKISCSHVYEITNYGVSPVMETKLTFIIPMKIKTPSGLVQFVEIFPPKMNIDSTSIFCNPVAFEYQHNTDVATFQNNTYSKSVVISSAQGRWEEMKKQKRKGAESEHHGVISALSLPETRTHYINCSSPDLECGIIECIAGPFKSSHTGSVVSFPLKINPKPLEIILESKDIVVLSSFGYADIIDQLDLLQPEGHRPDFADSSTIFFGKLPESKISPWFIALGVIIGLLILALLIWALVKMGFFKREKKEELKSYRNKSEMEEALTGNMVD